MRDHQFDSRAMKTSSLLLALAVLAVILTADLPARAATLNIGDPAPALHVAKWVQGEPVQSFDSNHVYIVSFWSTWIAQGETSIERLNAIWQNYKGRGLI